jgi:hypothetical protein
MIVDEKERAFVKNDQILTIPPARYLMLFPAKSLRRVLFVLNTTKTMGSGIGFLRVTTGCLSF